MSDINKTSDAPSLGLLSHTQPHTFITPLKRINEGQDVSGFLISKAYGDIMTFLLQLNRAMFPSYIPDVSTSGQRRVQTWDLGCEAVAISEDVHKLKRLLEELDRIIDEVPPDPGPRRFGNASFKKWYQTVEERSSEFLHSHLPESTLQYPHDSDVKAESELSSYFLGSFGSPQRLDYGSGHELSFLAFLGCIWKLGGFSYPDEHSIPGHKERAIVLGLIVPYLSLVRRLILTYTLEPAGSHGVWGLDDHSFIPYILGSAQYGPAISPHDPTPIEGSRPDAPNPADVAKLTAVDRQRHQNMYFGAIGFIHDVKRGPFWEHSPMLYDISGIRAGWGKINKGMLKMYDAEVLSKFPVVQHFRFGSLFSFDPDPDATPPPASVHAANQPVRDGFASAAAEKIAAPRAPPNPPQPGTQAPWANHQTPSMPGGPHTNTTAAPWSTIGTAAPWANNKPTTTMIDPADSTTTAPRFASSKGTPSAAAESGTVAGRQPTKSTFPQAKSREVGAFHASRRIPPTTANDDDDDDDDTTAGGQTMPPPQPPTRAPWAKPPRDQSINPP